MTDNQLIDDVKELLEKELGDPRILQQIKRACENNEAVAKTERDYVQNLKEKFLASPPPEPEPEPQPPQQETIQPSIEDKPIEIEQPQITTTISKTKLTVSKNKMIGIGAGAVAAVIIAAVALSGGGDIGTPETTIPSSGILLESDVSTYNKGDIISISGTSDLKFGSEIVLSISNSQNILIWTETVKLKSSGQFSTLTIAGGEGWENSGTYTISAQHGDKLEQTKFSFNG